MGIDRTFYCMPEENKYQNKYLEARNNYPEVSIPDDIIGYINDTLNWITCIHISRSHLIQT
jgi:hypothetical protein